MARPRTNAATALCHLVAGLPFLCCILSFAGPHGYTGVIGVAAGELAAWRRRTYAELAPKVGQSQRLEIAGPNDVSYQVEIQILWDSNPNGAVRVIGCIDDGGWSSVAAVTDDFIVAPDGTFVGE